MKILVEWMIANKNHEDDTIIQNGEQKGDIMSLVLFVLVWIGVEFKKSIDREKEKVKDEESRICVEVYNNIQK
jgi:hypothetical protein